jgi:hypothetical protein
MEVEDCCKSMNLDFDDMGSLLNLVLVNENVRPAFLFQPIDFGESSPDGEKSKKILNYAKTFFPNLTHFETYQGVLIYKDKEKTLFNGNILLDDNILSEEMGRILGYPCYKESPVDSSIETVYAVDVNVKIKDNNIIQLFGNNCKDYSPYQTQYEDFAKEAKNTFAKFPYLNVVDVFIEVTKYPSLNSIIDKLIRFDTIDADDKTMIGNTFYNACFPNLDSIHFEEDNPIHRGILVGILLKEKHCLLEPFFPLKPDSVEYKEVSNISKRLEDDIIDVLNKSIFLEKSIFLDKSIILDKSILNKKILKKNMNISCPKVAKFYELEQQMIKDGYDGRYAIVTADLTVRIVSTEDEAIRFMENNADSFYQRIGQII